jgi:hypothetical protein
MLEGPQKPHAKRLIVMAIADIGMGSLWTFASDRLYLGIAWFALGSIFLGLVAIA